MNIRIGQNTASFSTPSLNAQEFNAQILKQEILAPKANSVSPKIDSTPSISESVKSAMIPFQDIITQETQEFAYKFAVERLQQFSRTPSFSNLNPKQQKTMLDALAQLSISCYTRKSFASPKEEIAPNVLGIMRTALKDICSGKCLVKFGNIDLSIYKGRLDNICINSNLVTLNENSYYAVAIHDKINPQTKLPYIKDTIYFSNTLFDFNVTTDIDYTTWLIHEYTHIIDFSDNAPDKEFNCAANLSAEFKAFQNKSTFFFGSTPNQDVAKRFGEFYNNQIKAYYYEVYNNLTAPQKVEYELMIGELKNGSWITPENFESRLQNAQ